MSPEIEDLFGQARALGLRRFVICNRIDAIEYEIDESGASYRPTRRRALIGTDGRGRMRPKLPWRWGGHVLTRSVEFVDSVFFNFDLARQGYVRIHLFPETGPETRSPPRLLVRAILDRVLRRIRVTTGRARSRSAIFRGMAAPRTPGYSVVPNRILMVTPSFARGGSEQQTFNTAELLIQRGYDVCMLSLRPLEPGEPGYMNEIDAHGLAYQILPRTITRGASSATVSDELRGFTNDLPSWLVGFFDATVKAIKDFRPAVVHCWLDQAVVIGGLSASLVGTPRIVAHQLVMVMGDPPDAEVIYREGYLSLASNPATALVSNSKGGAVSYEQWLGLNGDTFHVLTNVLAPTTVRRPSAEEIAAFRTSLKLRPGDRVVATIIRLVAQKDPLLWVDAAAIVAAQRPDVRFLLGGYGVLEDAVREKIDSLGLADRITMLGAVTDLGLVYAATDVFMLSSRFEGLPCVLLEAQSTGRPVVATDVGGNAEAFRDGITGRLVKQRSAEALADAVLQILDDPDWAKRAAVEAPRHVASSFGPDPYIDKLLDIYGLPHHAKDLDPSPTTRRRQP